MKEIKRLKEWSDKVKERDNNTCQICGKTELVGHECHAHHIYPKEKYESLQYELYNGITLCKSCHHSLHNSGKGNPMYGVHRYDSDAPFYGQHHTDETKQRLSDINIGKELSNETRKKMSVSHSIPVVQIDKRTFMIVTEYPSAKIASEKTGIDKSSINKCCKGKLMSAGKFYWRTKNDK